MSDTAAPLDTSLTRRMNDTILLSVPRTIEGRPSRRADIFATAAIPDEARFDQIIQCGGWLTWERLLADEDVTRIKLAASEGRQIQSPAGIPGYDRVRLGGCRMVNLAKATGLLSQVRYAWRPPVYLSTNEHGEKIMTQGVWTLEITVTDIRHNLLPREWSDLRREFLPSPPPRLQAA